MCYSAANDSQSQQCSTFVATVCCSGLTFGERYLQFMAPFIASNECIANVADNASWESLHIIVQCSYSTNIELEKNYKIKLT